MGAFLFAHITHISRTHLKARKDKIKAKGCEGMAFNYGFPNYGYNPGNTYMPQQPQQIQQPMQSGVMCRPVSSIEEAKGMQVQFDGSLYAFINLNAGEIYTKQFNFNTGSMDFEIYTKAKPAPPVAYATTSDIEEIRKELAALKKAKEVEHDE